MDQADFEWTLKQIRVAHEAELRRMAAEKEVAVESMRNQHQNSIDTATFWKNRCHECEAKLKEANELLGELRRAKTKERPKRG